MIPFSYSRAADAGQALALASTPGAKFLGGGTNHVDLMRETVERPTALVDVTGLAGCFVVLHIADPAGHIFEIDETNNVSARIVRLPYRRGASGCPPYVP